MGRFTVMRSGNPSRRPMGALEKTTLATQALLDGEAEILTRKVVELAKEGHRVSASLPEEAVAPWKDQPWPFSFLHLSGGKEYALDPGCHHSGSAQPAGHLALSSLSRLG